MSWRRRGDRPDRPRPVSSMFPLLEDSLVVARVGARSPGGGGAGKWELGVVRAPYGVRSLTNFIELEMLQVQARCGPHPEPVMTLVSTRPCHRTVARRASDCLAVGGSLYTVSRRSGRRGVTANVTFVVQWEAIERLADAAETARAAEQASRRPMEIEEVPAAPGTGHTIVPAHR